MNINIEEDSPDNWIVKFSRSKPDKSYFYNKKTKKSQWGTPAILKARKTENQLQIKSELKVNAKNVLNYSKSEASNKELLIFKSNSGIYKQNAQNRLKNLQMQLHNKKITKDNLLDKDIITNKEIIHLESHKCLKNNNNKSNKHTDKVKNKTYLASKRLENLQKKLVTIQKTLENSEKTEETNDIEMYNEDDYENCHNINNADNTVMEWEEIDYANMFNEINNVRKQNSPESNITTFSFNSQLQTDTATIKEFNLLNLNNDKFMNNKLYIVIDTNVFLSNLKFIEQLPRIFFKNIGNPIIIVPYIVLCELDKLKHRSDSKLRVLAVQAIKFLHEKFKNNNKNFYGQSIHDMNNTLIPIENPDDNILNCCLQIKTLSKNIILLTNDINLINKAFCCAVKGYTNIELEKDYNKIELQ